GCGKACGRRGVRGTFTAGSAAYALALAGCGGGSNNKQTTNTAATTAASAAAAKPTLDPAQGKRGGRLVWQGYGDPGGGLELIKIRNAGVEQLAGLIHEGLLEVRNGTPTFKGTDAETKTQLAPGKPEQPDGQTYVFKLRPAKFHNGRAVNSEDVKYSFDKFVSTDSAWKADMPFYDRVETPDPQTAVVKTKSVYADTLATLAARDVCII